MCRIHVYSTYISIVYHAEQESSHNVDLVKGVLSAAYDRRRNGSNEKKNRCYSNFL